MADTRAQLTLHDRLSRLDYRAACALLGPNGAALLRAGGAIGLDVSKDVAFTKSHFRLRLPRARGRGRRGRLTVTLSLADDRRRQFSRHCSDCTSACEHVAAALALILEEKVALGLAKPPCERAPSELLSDDDLLERALDDRRERARTERMTLRASDPKTVWSDYAMTSHASGKTYRLAMRGGVRGESYCSCPDFRTNTLGTCKHIIAALAKLRKRFGAEALGRPYRRREISLSVVYGERAALRLNVPNNAPNKLPNKAHKKVLEVAGPLLRGRARSGREVVKRLKKLERLGHSVTVYPDAGELLDQMLFAERIGDVVGAIRKRPAKHRLRRELLRHELLPYQLDGIGFAVGAGRAILADDMGLGKTVQGIGVAELLAREAGISRVLVVTPASVKTQWRKEIERFSWRSVQLVMGSKSERPAQYASDSFFTICNYEQVLRDVLAIERVPWDLIILDEGQRIKNWEAKTTAVIKSLRSRFALVLSGTPLENRLADLYSIVEFVDDRRLGPAFRFFPKHRVVDERGKVIGYNNLAELRANLAPVLLRRTRESVMRDLPARTTEIVRINPSAEQKDMHDAHMRVVAQIVAKPFINEMDLLRLQKSLLMARMAADSTFLVDKQKPGFSTKLTAAHELLEGLLGEDKRKIVVFSEWTSMLDLIEEPLAEANVGYVRLDGKVGQKKRQALVDRFQRDPQTRIFLASNAGATGLNLQAADTIVNVDLPWNPAVLEQRIARAHRMGQKRPVHVYILMTVDTIEENMLETLSGKSALAMAALDSSSDVDKVDLVSGIDELRRRLEVLLGAKPDAAIDESMATDAMAEVTRGRRVAAASGQMLVAALSLIDELVPKAVASPEARAADQHLATMLRERLSGCLATGEDGQTQLTVTLPNREALGPVADSLARLISLETNGFAARDLDGTVN